MSSKRNVMSKSEYFYLSHMDEIHDQLNDQIECFYNRKSFGYNNTNNELDFYVNLYLNLSEKYILDFDDVIDYELKKDSQGKKYFIMDYDMLPNGEEVEIREYLKINPNINLENISKNKIIRSVKNIATKVKLLNPKVYNNARAFYLTVES